MTKIYCDIADINLIKIFKRKKLVKGFTTNPTLMKKAGAKNYSVYSKKIINTLKKTKQELSLEVLADDLANMRRQAYMINSWNKNVFVKIPVLNSSGIFQRELIKELSDKRININITAVFSVEQCKKILKIINKKSKVIISIFVGRLGDSGKDALSVMKKCIYLSKKYKNVQILWASTREPYNFHEAKKLGCQIITAPPGIIEKIEKFGKSFNKLTTDTVKGFLTDSKKSKFSI